MKKILYALLSVLFSSCAALPHSVTAPPRDAGHVAIYLQPFSQEADALLFTISGIAAVREDGEKFPLPVRLSSLDGASIIRQRLLSEGAVPKGSYAGFSLLLGKARLKSDEGEAELLVPEKEVSLAFPFQVGDRSSTTLFLGLNYDRSVTNGYSFSPVFSVSPPTRPIVAVQAYLSNPRLNALTVLDKNLMLAAGDIALRGAASGVVVDQRQKRAYATATDSDAVEVIDAPSQTRLNRIRLNPGDEPRGIAVSPDGRTLLTVNAGSNTLSIIDTASLTETARVPVGIGAESVLIDPSGRRAYVFNTASDSLSVVDIAKRAIVTSISTEPEPLWGQFNAKGDRLYIIHGRSPYMTVLDPLRLAVVSRVYVGMGMTALKVDPATDLIYAGRKNDKGIEIYDPATLAPFDFIQTGEGPVYMTIDGEGNNLWLIGGRTSSVIVVNLASKKAVAEIEAGEGASRLALMGER